MAWLASGIDRAGLYHLVLMGVRRIIPEHYYGVSGRLSFHTEANGQEFNHITSCTMINVESL